VTDPQERMRVRLRFAVLTLAILPSALSIAVFAAVLGRSLTGDVLVSFSLTVVFALVVAGLTLLMARRIVQPVEQPASDVATDESLVDALTGLGNHRAFHEELDRALVSYDRYHVPVAVLVLDIDDITLVNESQGHAAGDALLREMGRLMSELTRFSDRSFRIDGDKFGLLMPHTDVEGAMQMAHRLLERSLRPRDGTPPIAFSGGVSVCPQYATTRMQLYAQAEAALDWCKHHGRASIDVFHPQRDSTTTHESSFGWSAQIAKVVSERLVQPVYQPIVDLETGRVLGFEGLSRPDAESGFPDPGTMFAAAATVGRTVELDLACLHAVIAGARNMPADQLLAVNISPRTIEAPHFSSDALLAILADYGMPANRVVVELTEREKIEDMTRLQAALSALQRAGLRIAADDVGAGNAGLRLLSQFRFDIVKIDLSLVQDGTERDSSRAVLRSLRDLASRWGASVIAEGLETAGQLRTVHELGVTAGQGYLLARPIAKPDLAWIDIQALGQGGAILDLRLPQYRQAPEAVRSFSTP
jgi:diguanylate cyclase (GGDEF)-like protein